MKSGAKWPPVKIHSVELEPAACQLHDKSGRIPRRGELERNPQPETDGTAAVDAFLGISVCQLPELVVEIDFGYQFRAIVIILTRVERFRVYSDIEIAQERKRPPPPPSSVFGENKR